LDGKAIVSEKDRETVSAFILLIREVTPKPKTAVLNKGV
jgi:hypothetical protein